LRRKPPTIIPATKSQRALSLSSHSFVFGNTNTPFRYCDVAIIFSQNLVESYANLAYNQY